MKILTPCLLPLICAFCVPELTGQDVFARVTKDHVPRDTIQRNASAIADFDGDGDLDVVTRSELMTNFLGRFISSGTYTMQPIVYGAHDFDGDGRSDLLDAREASARTAGVSLNRLPFTFTRQEFSSVSSGTVTAHAVADFDGDGDLDIILGYFSVNSRTSQLENNGLGNFTDATAVRMPTMGFAMRGAWPSDVDGDGDIDLIVGSRTFQGGLHLMLNQGGGVFSAPNPSPFAASTAQGVLHLVDIDNDGDEDLIGDGGRLVENRQGTFIDAATQVLPVRDDTELVRSADLDSDGDLDLWIEYGKGRYQAGWFENPGTVAPYVDRRLSGALTRRDTEVLSIADVDGDGILDILSVGTTVLDEFSSGKHLQYLLGQPNGEFVDMTPENPISLVYGDYNNDGFVDGLFFPRFLELFVRESNGVGGFSERRVSTFAATDILGHADVDSDGDIDLLVTGPWPTSAVTVLDNDGNGNFQSVSNSIPSTVLNTEWLLFADVDADGDVDLIVNYDPPNSPPAELQVLRNDGAGVFAFEPQWQIPSLQNLRLLTGVALDADNDGDVDLITGTDDPVLLLNDGSGAMTPATGAIPGRFATANVRPSELSVDDVDGDGDVDLFVSYTSPVNSGNSEDGTLFENDGAGSFTVRTVFDEGRRWTRARLVDLVVDGVPELVVSSSDFINGSVTTIYENDRMGGFTPGRRGFDGPFNLSNGRFIDTDGDRDRDLDYVAIDAEYKNLTAQMRCRFAPRVGGRLEIEVANTSSFGTTTAFLVLSTGRLPQPIGFPELGRLVVDPGMGTTVFIRSPFIRSPMDYVVNIPNSSSLAGLEIFAQALVTQIGMTPRFTNAIRELIAF